MARNAAVWRNSCGLRPAGTQAVFDSRPAVPPVAPDIAQPQRLAVGGGEHQLMRSPVLGQLRDHRHNRLRHRHVARLPGLGRAVDHLAVHLRDRPIHAQPRAQHVHVGDPQRCRLAEPQPGVGEDVDQHPARVGRVELRGVALLADLLGVGGDGARRLRRTSSSTTALRCSPRP